MYTLPFEITSRIIELISVVSEKIGEIQYLQDSAQHVRLRKENRIKTIHASLAIENNSLSIEQITAIIVSMTCYIFVITAKNVAVFVRDSGE